MCWQSNGWTARAQKRAPLTDATRKNTSEETEIHATTGIFRACGKGTSGYAIVADTSTALYSLSHGSNWCHTDSRSWFRCSKCNILPAFGSSLFMGNDCLGIGSLCYTGCRSYLVSQTVTPACVNRICATARLERRRRELARAILPARLARGSASPFCACTHSALWNLVELAPLFCPLRQRHDLLRCFLQLT